MDIPKSLQKSIGIDTKKSGSKRRSRNRSSPSDKSCSPSGFFSSITSRASLKEFRRSRSKEFSSSGASETSSKIFTRDAGSTPRRSRQSMRSTGKENKFSKRKSSSSFGASLELKEANEISLDKSGSGKQSAKKVPPRVCQLVNENLFCISGMSALTINTPPSAYRKMAFTNHSMVTRSMTKNKENCESQNQESTLQDEKLSDKKKEDKVSENLGISLYEASPKGRVRKKLSLLDSSVTSENASGPGLIETDFPYADDSILARGPSLRLFRKNSLRESKTSICRESHQMANTMNATISSLHSILEDRELITADAPAATRSSLRNTSVLSAVTAPTTYFLTPNSKLRKSAKQRNASSTATCTRHDKKCVNGDQQQPVLKATVKRSKSVTFSSKKEVAFGRLSASEKRQRSLSHRRKQVSASKESIRVEMREDAGHTPKLSRKKQEPFDERLI